MDLYPTILELVGLEKFGEDRAIDGQSLAPLLKGQPYARTMFRFGQKKATLSSCLINPPCLQPSI